MKDCERATANVKWLERNAKSSILLYTVRSMNMLHSSVYGAVVWIQIDYNFIDPFKWMRHACVLCICLRTRKRTIKGQLTKRNKIFLTFFRLIFVYIPIWFLRLFLYCWCKRKTFCISIWSVEISRDLYI